MAQGMKFFKPLPGGLFGCASNGSGRDRDRNARRTGGAEILGGAVAGRKFPASNSVRLLAEIGTGDNGNFVPAVPINITIFFEQGIKAGFVEWHSCPRMAEQLRKLAALKFKHLLRAANTGFPSAFHRCAGGVTGCCPWACKSKLQNLPLANALELAQAWERRMRPETGPLTPHTDGP